MNPVALKALAFAALAIVTSDQALSLEARPEAPASSDLMTAFRASDIAEIYIIGRSVAFPIAPRPATVRAFGCLYRVPRESPQWHDLERALADADIRMAPLSSDAPIPEVRVGLILGDGQGTIREVYTRYPGPAESVVPGFSQRQLVEISASFVTVLESFASRHRNLALDPALPIPLCTRGDRPQAELDESARPRANTGLGPVRRLRAG